MINIQSVSMTFGSMHLLKDISLNINEGETLSIIGPSGQGKSVFLKMIGGILKPSNGQILVSGIDLYNCKISERNEIIRKMGMLFQKNALFDSLTCGENIAFPLREVAQLDESEINKRVDYFLEEVGISHAKKLFPDEISGGMQKRLGIARALALYPKIIFYDDPTAGLDPITSRKIIDLIIQLRNENKTTVVAITNDMNRAYQLGGKIGMIVDQELILMQNEEDAKKCQDPRVFQFIRGQLTGPLTVNS